MNGSEHAVHPRAAVADWLHAHDPDCGAARRAARAALIMPGMFALGDVVIGNSVLATFAAFGSFAMLLLVDYAGTIHDRLLAQAALGVTCAALICLGTLCAQATWLAVLSMAVVAFAVVFAGAVSSVLAGATTTLLLAFILPVSFAGPLSSIPDRVAGWSLAATGRVPCAIPCARPPCRPVTAGRRGEGVLSSASSPVPVSSLSHSALRAV